MGPDDYGEGVAEGQELSSGSWLAVKTKAVEAMSRIVSAEVGKRYGLAFICRTWGVVQSTDYWHRNKEIAGQVKRRSGPLGPCPDEQLVEEIRTEMGNPLSTAKVIARYWPG